MANPTSESRSDAFNTVRDSLLAAADELTSNFTGNADHGSDVYVGDTAVNGNTGITREAYRDQSDGHRVHVQTFDYGDHPSDPANLYRLDFAWPQGENYYFGSVFQDGSVEYDSTDAPGGLIKSDHGYPGRPVLFSETEPDFVRERDVFSIEDVARGLQRVMAFIRGEAS